MAGCTGCVVSLGGVVAKVETHILEHELAHLTADTESFTHYGGGGTVVDAVQYHRPTHHKIKSLKNFIKNFPNADEFERNLAASYLKLDPQVVHFWYRKKAIPVKRQSVREQVEAIQVETGVLRAFNQHSRESVSRNICCLDCILVKWWVLDNQHLQQEMEQLKSEGARYLAGHNQQNLP